ncbi:SCO family protein [Marinimicrobium alkaliphilum]|uniref:SCO family protein n=1 Tax=Marinimicrobium alkaliphilum TaxID=2202654 RepID=UPI0018E081A0|nr:SCO family protein [Marinimicrobium alkaliphilum]
MASEHNPNHTEAQKRGIRRTVFFLVLLVLVVIGLAFNKILREPPLDRDQLRQNNAFLLESPRRFTPFELVDHRGESFTHEDLQGQWSLVFFGFTHCPDICPMTMMDLADLVQVLPEDIADNTQVLLVTVDPGRDTPGVLAEYVPHFNEDFIGVTGEFLTIRRFANELNVAFARVTQGDDYTVDHGSQVVLINPKGDYHAFFRPPFDIEQLNSTYGAIYRDFRF